MRHKVKKQALIPAIIAWTAIAGGIAAAAAGLTWEQGTFLQESSGNWSAQSTSTSALGGYQMTKGALQDTGYINSSGAWTGLNGINSAAQFVASPAAQTAAFDSYSSTVWSRDQSIGLTNYVGQSVNGQTLNQSAILGGSYLLGPGGMQTYINTGEVYTTPNGYPCSPGASGCSANPHLTSQAQQYISNASQMDSSAVTSSNMQVSASSPVGGVSGGSGGTTASSLYCASNVASLLGQGATQYVNQEMAMATNPQTGFTLLNGSGIGQAAGASSGVTSGGGLGGLSGLGGGTFGAYSCLSNLLGGNMNILFEPPNLSAILQQLLNQVCSAAQNMVAQAVQPLDASLYKSVNLGGFFPGMAMPSLGSGVFMSASQGGTSGISVAGLGGQTQWYGISGSDSALAASTPTFFTNLLAN